MDTKKIIEDAAFEIFENTPFEKVTVQQIIEKAHVSRKTFYRFFQDKYMLMHRYYSHYVDIHVNEKFNGKNWRETEVKAIEFLLERKSFFQNVRELEGQDSFWSFLNRYSFDFIKDIRLRNTGSDQLTEKEYYTILFVVEGSIAICKDLVKGKVSMSPEEVTNLIYDMVPDGYREYPD